MELMFESRTRGVTTGIPWCGIKGKVYFFQRKPEIHPEPVLVPDAVTVARLHLDRAEVYAYELRVCSG